MYRFKEEFRDARISIPSLRLTVTRFNLTDELGEMILKRFPKLAHNIEKVELPPARATRSRQKFIE